uniref:Uncharacterized protein n=1 Tax=Panagrolaimus superbus TaxID=310955 RepID=A0A914Z7B4_9BILA
MSNPPMVEVNLGNNSPKIYTIPSPSFTPPFPHQHPLYSNDPWPASSQTGVCFDANHYSQNSCHTNLPPNTPYIIRTMPYDSICATEQVQLYRRRQTGIILCGCIIFSLPIIIFFVVMSIVLTTK